MIEIAIPYLVAAAILFTALAIIFGAAEWYFGFPPIIGVCCIGMVVALVIMFVAQSVALLAPPIFIPHPEIPHVEIPFKITILPLEL
jgi:hypothetical protein